MAEPLTDAEMEFIDRLGVSTEAGGLTRITGRIWGVLLVVGEPMSQAEISETLQISRGSVSTNIKVLEALDLLEIKIKAADRQAYYGMRDHPYTSMAQALAKRTANDAALIRNALETIERPAARKRLEDLATFYDIMEAGYAETLRRLNELKS